MNTGRFEYSSKRISTLESHLDENATKDTLVLLIFLKPLSVLE